MSSKSKRTLTVCPRCKAQPGHPHQLGCSIERCPYCGGMLLLCLSSGCQRADYDTPWPPPLDDRLFWTGEWPGLRECRKFGWYARRVKGKGWLDCDKTDEGAQPNLNRLVYDAVWDREKKQYVRRPSNGPCRRMQRRS
jgi:hypothetical protein